MRKIIHKNTTVIDVIGDPEIQEQMEKERDRLEEKNGLVACTRYKQVGKNVHCWAEAKLIKLNSVVESQNEFYRSLGIE